MQISLITVSYNCYSTLKETILSVKKQNLKNLEYIVIDGGSTDGTLDLLKDSSDIVNRWISEPDSGIYDAMNKGLRLATGDVVGFLHSDDCFASNDILASVLMAFSQNKIDALYGDLEYVSQSDSNKTIRYWKANHFNPKNLSKGWMPPHPTFYFKRELINKVGMFDTSYRIAADYEWMLRVLKNHSLSVFYLPKVLIKMRLGGASNKSIKNIILKSKEDYRALKKHAIGGVYSLLLKNFSKIGQFFVKS